MLVKRIEGEKCNVAGARIMDMLTSAWLCQGDLQAWCSTNTAFVHFYVEPIIIASRHTWTAFFLPRSRETLWLFGKNLNHFTLSFSLSQLLDCVWNEQKMIMQHLEVEECSSFACQMCNWLEFPLLASRKILRKGG